MRLWPVLLALSCAAADLNQLAQEHLARRRETIAAITTEQQARERQRHVRRKILELIGGLPDYTGPLNPRVTGSISRNEYVIEKVLFESLPQLFVSANIYRPTQPGRYPAVLIPMGHWDQGKAAAQTIAANLALKGFVAMPFDPIGQGERQQAFDPRAGRSLIGGAVDQHFLAGAQAILVGQSLARYRIWDAKRAIDYLVSRPDVDAGNIGVTGCSGGGTVSTYIAALDDRVKAAAPACYLTSFVQLFGGPVGDSEQSLTGFLSSGLDQADYVELFAPKPWLIASTENDFFPIEGTRQLYEEARRWYRLFGTEERVHAVVGPGGHGTPLPVREAIYGWMIRWLRDGSGDAREVPIDPVPDVELRVTASGQVPGRDLSAVIAECRTSEGSLDELRSALKQWIPPEGRTVWADISVPGIEGKAPALIVLGKAPELKGHAIARLEWPAEEPRGYVGRWQTSTRALLLGMNRPGLQAREVLDAFRILAARADVDARRIGVYARGTDVVTALLAAAAEPGIAHVWIDEAPYSLRAALGRELHQGLYEALIPGFALRWDLQDLVRTIGPEKVTWTDPTDWMENVVSVPGRFRYRPADASADGARFRPGW